MTEEMSETAKKMFEAAWTVNREIKGPTRRVLVTPAEVTRAIRESKELVKKKKYGEAEMRIRKAIDAYDQPENSMLWEALGQVFSAWGKWEQAERSYRSATCRIPLVSTFWSGRAQALEKLGKVKEAKAAREIEALCIKIRGGE
ncbi:MAG: hypothetical protein ACE5IO_03460 [Thermoplasmata archaeon]